MNRNFLLPNTWKKWGFIILGLGILVGLFNSFRASIPLRSPMYGIVYQTYSHDNVFTVSYTVDWTQLPFPAGIVWFFICIVPGLLAIFFTKEKVEDELISKMRLDSLAWAVIANCLIILIANFGFWGYTFLGVLLFNATSIIIIALLRFNYLKYKFNSGSEVKMNNTFMIKHIWKYLGYVLTFIAMYMHYYKTENRYYTNLLIPNSFDLAWNNAIAFIYGKAPAYASAFADYTDFWNTVLILVAITGLLLITFSREKIEDEFISDLRLKSLSLAVIAHYAVLTYITLHDVGGFSFLDVMAYAMFTPMIFFIIRFNYLKYKMRKSLANEMIEGEAS